MNNVLILPAAGIAPAVEIDYVNYRSERGTRRITPEFIGFGRTTYHPQPQWMLVAEDHGKSEKRTFAMSDIRRVGQWNEGEERALFEHEMYAHYERVRTQRKSRGQGVAFDTLDVRPKHELFARDGRGDYVAVIYGAAWAGWKASRGAA